MTDESFIVALAGRRWALPHLPFRIIKSIQPALLRVYSETADLGAGALAEAQIDALAASAWQAVAHVDPDLSYEDFLSLPFSLTDLFAALPAVAQAAGLRTQAATSEASPDAGK